MKRKLIRESEQAVVGQREDLQGVEVGEGAVVDELDEVLVEKEFAEAAQREELVALQATDIVVLDMELAELP